MINGLKFPPKILGSVELPEVHRRRSMIGKQVMLQLPDLSGGYALKVEFSDYEDLKIGRKQILQACGLVYGHGKVKTISEGNHLFVWLLQKELAFAKEVRDHRFNTDQDVENDN